jgi:hypothetical protein
VTPTNRLRWLNKFNYGGGYTPVLQQWWEGFGSDTAINYAHPDAHKLSKNPPGAWRDVEYVDE